MGERDQGRVTSGPAIGTGRTREHWPCRKQDNAAGLQIVVQNSPPRLLRGELP